MPLQWTANYGSATDKSTAPHVDAEIQRLHAAGIKCTKPHLMHYLDKAGVSYSQQGTKKKPKANGKQAARGID